MKKKWIERQQAILAAARAAGRSLTAEEQAEFDALQRKIDDPAQGGEPDGQGDKGGQGGEPAGGQRSVGGQDPMNTPTPPPAGTPSATSEESAKRAVAEERQRINDILALCRQTGMDPAEHIRSGATMDAVRAAAVDYMIQHGAPVVVGARDSGMDNFRDAARDAMLIQAGVELDKPAQGAEDMRGMSMRDMLIECMARSGEGTVTELLRRSRADLWDAAVRQVPPWHKSRLTGKNSKRKYAKPPFTTGFIAVTFL